MVYIGDPVKAEQVIQQAGWAYNPSTRNIYKALGSPVSVSLTDVLTSDRKKKKFCVQRAFSKLYFNSTN